VEEPAQNPELDALSVLIGVWAIEAKHPAYPTTVVPGHTTFEWLEGHRFLIQRSWAEHPDFPDSISVIGVTDEELSMHYFDSRGVHRVYRLGLSDGTLRIWREAPGFSQRFAGTVGGDGQTISGLWELSRDDGSTWDDDLEIEFRRLPE
jgi:hypothetical protein